MSLDFSLVDPQTDAEIASFNITSNLANMAREAGIYEILWRPSSLHPDIRAGSVVAKLETALLELITEPRRFEAFNAKNGWGVRENLVTFVANVLKVAKANEFAKLVACV